MMDKLYETLPRSMKSEVQVRVRQEDPDRSLLAGTENIEYNQWKMAAWVGGWWLVSEMVGDCIDEGGC